MSARTYATRPIACEAAQVTGLDAAEEIVRWVTEAGGEAKSNSRFRPGGVAESAGVQIRAKDHNWYNANEGDWVVQLEGSFRVVTDDFFTANFDSIGSAERHGASD